MGWILGRCDSIWGKAMPWANNSLLLEHASPAFNEHDN